LTELAPDENEFRRSSLPSDSVLSRWLPSLNRENQSRCAKKLLLMLLLGVVMATPPKVMTSLNVAIPP